MVVANVVGVWRLRHVNQSAVEPVGVCSVSARQSRNRVSSHSHASEARWLKSPLGVPITCACATPVSQPRACCRGGSERGGCVAPAPHQSRGGVTQRTQHGAHVRRRNDRRTHDEVGGARSTRQLARGSSLAQRRRCRLCARRRRCGGSAARHWPVLGGIGELRDQRHGS